MRLRIAAEDRWKAASRSSHVAPRSHMERSNSSSCRLHLLFFGCTRRLFSLSRIRFRFAHSGSAPNPPSSKSAKSRSLWWVSAHCQNSSILTIWNWVVWFLRFIVGSPSLISRMYMYELLSLFPSSTLNSILSVTNSLALSHGPRCILTARTLMLLMLLPIVAARDGTPPFMLPQPSRSLSQSSGVHLRCLLM